MDTWIYILIGLVAYVAILSLVAIFITRKDKNAAKANKWRVKEATLLIVSALGGSIAMFITMKIIRHKTDRKKFMLGIPLIIFLQIVLLIGIGILYWQLWS
ncbi:MAG: DUF1294 domain-containing protein [Firmicutes bacterium]|nr:DUF1294 domain-containing protein [Bacillota bacterium]